MQARVRFTVGVVVAGGQGVRMGFRKQHALLAGVPMWLRSTEALFRGTVDVVYVVVPNDDRETVESQIDHAQLEHSCFVVTGGTSRASSVWNGLQALVRDITPSHGQGTGASVAARSRFPFLATEDLASRMERVTVLVHDAARPFVSVKDVQSVSEKAQATGAAILAHPCNDTVKFAPSAKIQKTISRDGLWMAETPQAFCLATLYDAYQRLEDLTLPTDDAGVIEAAGLPVFVVPSSSLNMKITTRADLDYAHWYADRLWGNANERSEPVDTSRDGV